jgi:hypothetical protein
MALRASLTGRISNSIIAVARSDGRLSSSAPGVTLKNQISEIRSIEDIADVAEVNVVEGATLVYNASLDKYEVRLLAIEDLGALDGGTF